MDFPDIIFRNNNYVENLHAMGNNENKNIIFIQQFYIPKQLSKFLWNYTMSHLKQSQKV